MNNTKEKNSEETVIRKLFSSRSEGKWLILILLLGFILRFLVASNVPIVADEPVHGMHAIGVLALHPLSTLSQSPLWFYITDIAYNLFGITLFSSRFLSFFFGSLTILVVYLLAKLLFNSRVALIAAFLLAISSYHIVWAAAYMDEGMMFFVLLGMYLFMKEYQTKKTISLWCAVAFGIALLVKIIAAVFIVALLPFILGILYQNYKHDKKLFRKNLKRTIIFGAILFLSFLPALSYNYFLYTQKGIVDLPFALYFGINREYYLGPGLAHEKGFDISQLGRSLHTMFFEAFPKFDPIFSLLALLGLPFIYAEYKKKKFQHGLIVWTFVFSVILVTLAVELPNHYTNFIPFAALWGGLFLEKAGEKISRKDTRNKIIALVCIAVLIFNAYHMWGSLSSKSGYDKLRRFASSSIQDNELVIADSRIYRGVIAWTFNDKHYIESSLLNELLRTSEQLPGEKYPTRARFIECVTDDCGWGTVQDNPALNESSEQLVALFKNISRNPIDITGGGSARGIKGNEVIGAPLFRIYSADLSLKAGTVQLADQTHSFFFYPVRRNLNPKAAFDYYEVKGPFETVLNWMSYLSLFTLLAAALISPLFLAYLVHKELSASKKQITLSRRKA